MLKDKVEKIIREVLGKMGVEYDGEIELSAPPKVEMGDFAFGCFPLAGILQKSPNEVAEKLVEEINGLISDNSEVSDLIESAEAMGPYVNFKLKRGMLFNDVYESIIDDGKNKRKTEKPPQSPFTKGEDGKDTEKPPQSPFKKGEDNKKKVMVEYLSPNTNKPLHLGHLRNGTLGMAVANILEAGENKVIKANLINDRGVHICKSMLAWKLFGEGETPETTGLKGDHFVGKYYVKFAEEAEKNPELEEQAQGMLQKWEEGDKEVRKLWEMMNKWVFDGFNSSFEAFGFDFDVIYRESETYKLGKDIVKNGLEKGIFKKEKNGAVVFVLPDSFGLDEDGNNKKITVLRKDGTSVYITQDLGTAVLKAEEYNLDQSIYVVGSEQEYYFKSLFEILKALGYPWAKNSYHLSYGMVYLPDGKMKSREGKVVDADDLVIKVKKMAKDGIRERQGDKKIDETELEERALKVALGAIKFYLLKVGPTQIIHFDPEESLSFEGFTGPYCQYAYARGSKLLRDAEVEQEKKMKVDFSVLGSKEELQLIQKILEGDDKIEMAGEKFNPSLIAVHIFELAKTFNQFYHGETILKAENNVKLARLALVQIFLQTIKKELGLLGIEVLEEM